MRIPEEDPKEYGEEGDVMITGLLKSDVYNILDNNSVIGLAESNPPRRRWLKHWVPQDTVLNPGKLRTLKWIPGDAIPELNDLKVSEEEEHEPEEEYESVYLCSFEGCGKVFTEIAALRKHLHVHGEKQFMCHHKGCGKGFMDSSKLKRHFLSHTGERQFVCPLEGCGKAFSLDFNLRSHMRTHTGEKYHACPFEDCGKRYAHEYKLRAHIRSYHDKNRPETTPPLQVEREREVVTPKPVAPSRPDMSASERPFACPHAGCTKRYIHEYKLNLHLRNTHLDEELETEQLQHEKQGSDDNEEEVAGGSDEEPPPVKATARSSGKGKLCVSSKSSASKAKRKRPTGSAQTVPSTIKVPIGTKPLKRQYQDDSEETEDEDGEDNDNDHWRGMQRPIAVQDDEETEDDVD